MALDFVPGDMPDKKMAVGANTPIKERYSRGTPIAFSAKMTGKATASMTSTMPMHAQKNAPMLAKSFRTWIKNRPLKRSFLSEGILTQ